MPQQPLLDAYPDLINLEVFSQSIAHEIYADYPQWLAHATRDGEYLVITIESPHPPTPRQLIIDTYNNEITVSFAPFYHSHFDCWACEQNEYFITFMDAKGFIEALLNEDVLIYWKVENEEVVRAGRCHPDELDELKHNWTHTYSWHGTHDHTR